MINVTCDKGNVHVAKMEGNALEIMSELCCIVDAICGAWCSDEKVSLKNDMQTAMIRSVAVTLIEKNPAK